VVDAAGDDVVDVAGADVVDAAGADVVDDAGGAKSVGGAEEVGLIRDAEEVVDDKAAMVCWRHHHHTRTNMMITTSPSPQSPAPRPIASQGRSIHYTGPRVTRL
jgi:hypothetical protein